MPLIPGCVPHPAEVYASHTFPSTNSSREKKESLRNSGGVNVSLL